MGVAKRFKTYDHRKLGNIRKPSPLHRMIAQPPFHNESFVNNGRKLGRIEIKFFLLSAVSHEN